MRYYLKVYKKIISNSITREMMFRANFFVDIFFAVIWLFVVILVIELLFGYTKSIAGWPKADVYLLSFVWFLFEETAGFGWKNIKVFSEKVRLGGLDILLTKPIDSQFIITLGAPKVKKIAEAAIIIIIYVLIFKFRVQVDVRWIHLPMFLILFASGLVIDYSIRLILNIFNIWFISLDNVNALWEGFINIAQYPISIFTKALKIIFLTFLPIGLLANVPTLALLGEYKLHLLLLSVSCALFFFLSARFFWIFAIKRYSSASS